MQPEDVLLTGYLFRCPDEPIALQRRPDPTTSYARSGSLAGHVMGRGTVAGFVLVIPHGSTACAMPDTPLTPAFVAVDVW
jgi:hypothetical protein